MEPQQPDSLIGLIGQLQDIVESAPVSIVPQTWAWAVIAALLLAVLVAGV